MLLLIECGEVGNLAAFLYLFQFQLKAHQGPVE